LRLKCYKSQRIAYQLTEFVENQGIRVELRKHKSRAIKFIGNFLSICSGIDKSHVLLLVESQKNIQRK